MEGVKHIARTSRSVLNAGFKSLLLILCIAVVIYGYKTLVTSKTVNTLYENLDMPINDRVPFIKDLTDEITNQRVTDMAPYLSFLDPYLPSCEAIFKNKIDKDTRLKQFEDILAEIKTHDDLVQRTKQRLKNKDGRCLVGHALQYMEETYFMAKIFRSEFVNTICETGFNAGHSTLLWLLLKPNVKVYSFDINQHKCTEPMAKYLLERFPNRLEIIFGDSTETVPKFYATHPDVKCDVAIIDGGHSRRVAEADVKNFYNMTSNLNFVFIDNYPDDNFSSALGPGWENAKRSGLIHELFHCKYSKGTQGFTLGRYIH